MNIICLYFISILIFGIYADYQLYEVTSFNKFERNLLYSFQVLYDDIVFPNGVSNEAAIPMNVLVKTDQVKVFETQLDLYGIQYVWISPFSM